MMNIVKTEKGKQNDHHLVCSLGNNTSVNRELRLLHMGEARQSAKPVLSVIALNS